jgi:phosphoribosylformylglycinamidine synthase subunit PurS
MRATVLVRPKPGILDPQGDAVGNSLRELGFAVETARVGRIVDLEVEAVSRDEARDQVERMCAELLANPLIESYEIELADSRAP